VVGFQQKRNSVKIDQENRPRDSSAPNAGADFVKTPIKLYKLPV